MEQVQKKIGYYTKKFNVANLKVRPAAVGRKRFTATFDRDGRSYVRHFGQPGALTFADGADRTKRLAFQARHSKIKDRSGRLAYMQPGSPASLSYWLLW